MVMFPLAKHPFMPKMFLDMQLHLLPIPWAQGSEVGAASVGCSRVCNSWGSPGLLLGSDKAVCKLRTKAAAVIDGSEPHLCGRCCAAAGALSVSADIFQVGFFH